MESSWELGSSCKTTFEFLVLPVTAHLYLHICCNHHGGPCQNRTTSQDPKLYSLLVGIGSVVSGRLPVSEGLQAGRQAGRQAGPCHKSPFHGRHDWGQSRLHWKWLLRSSPKLLALGLLLCWAEKAFVFLETTVFLPTKHPHLYPHNRLKYWKKNRI